MKGTFVALNLNKSSVSQCGNLPLNLRTPKLVMNLERLGSLFPQKYSFMRILHCLYFSNAIIEKFFNIIGK